jgi:ABC-type glycerol-3-phosphate transport system substrate-binding protein
MRSIRSVLLPIVLGLPAVLLLALGPRHAAEVPPDCTVIRYWEKWTGVEGRAVQDIVDRFNATVGATERIWVDYHAVANVEQRMLIATAGGDPPDVAGLFDHIIPQYADRNALLPVDDLCREFEIDLNALKPIWLQIGRYQGRLYALPSTPYTIALFYNRRLCREAGLDPDQPPQSIQELGEWSRKLTRRDLKSGKITHLGFTVSPAMLGWWHWIWPMFFDGQLWEGQRFSIDTGAALAAYHWIRSNRIEMGGVGLAANEVDPLRANRDVLAFEATAGAIEGAQNPFLSERLAMVFQGPWMTNWIETYTPNLDYGVAPFPSVSAHRPHHFASTDNFVIPRGSRHIRESMIFLKFMMQQENLEALAQAHGKVSPFRTPLPGFVEQHKNPHIRVFDALAGSPDAFGYPPMPMWPQVWTTTLNMMQSILEGREEVEAAVLDAQAKVGRIVEEYWRMKKYRGVSEPVS